MKSKQQNIIYLVHVTILYTLFVVCLLLCHKWDADARRRQGDATTPEGTPPRAPYDVSAINTGFVSDSEKERDTNDVVEFPS